MTHVDRARATARDERLCFALYTASRAMTSCYRPMLDGLGLTYPQYLVLVLLGERGGMSVTGIGHTLQLETGTLSPLLKRLEATGLGTRTRQVGDERSLDDPDITALRTTPHGITGSLRAAAGR
ncbi:MAG TPA: MarR family transcriptional regulator [Pseudonocardia sp.]|nr:MarR family transcriptional regulator [Pseudonocardia sp.]